MLTHITHITLNTGHNAKIPKSHAADETIQALKHLAKNGGNLPGSLADFHIELIRPNKGAVVWTLQRTEIPLTTCALCTNKIMAKEL
jgi:hypothetical protein